MSTAYAIKKCETFGFSNSIVNFLERFPGTNPIIIISDKLDPDEKFIAEDEFGEQELKENYIIINDIAKLKDIVEKYNHPEMIYINDKSPVFAIDLSSKMFDDIKISRSTDKSGESSKEQKLNKDDYQKQLTGKSSALDAFSNNLFAVIYGKKSANIQSCNTKQNHDVLDSLARNGVPCIPKTPEVLSIQKIIDYLMKLPKFHIFGIHPASETIFEQTEYPSEISHPSYKIGEGEILAVLYYYILINFFGYCSIITDSMRENAYIF